MNKLRVAVVGTGYLGRFHAQKYADMPDVELVGVVDIDSQRAESVAAEVGCPAYTDYRNLLGRVDAASIVVPTHSHFQVSKDFLENRADLMIEKPMTTTLEEADALIDISESQGQIIQVGHLERFNPAVVALDDILTKPLFIESHRLSTFKGRGVDVSVVLDLMIHDIDIISNLVRSEVTSIHAAGIPVVCKNVDIANARIEFESGCVANVTASRISTKDERKIRLFQPDAYLSVDFANHEITMVRPGGGQAESKESIIPGMEIQQRSFSKGDALQDELRSFINAVHRREVPEVTGKMGRDALKIALSIMAQIDQTMRRIVN